ncbi:hypothetical protein [Paraburkholderia youngii]|uniref:hypothetical protein n=1 Tax=Paraburkholderia youngii TaxID=2782701 RepID=UPI003D1CC95D
MNIQRRTRSAVSRFAVKILFGYVESETPPRCRNPRLVRREDGECTIRIPVLTDAEAPIALIACGKDLFSDLTWRVEYRWWKNRLWTSVNVDANSQPRGRSAQSDDWAWPAWRETVDLRADGSNKSLEFGFDAARYDSKAQTVRSIKRLQQEHVIINGTPHRPTRERGYRVTTFGLGGNHGGTGLFVEPVVDTRTAKSKGMFNLLDRDKAIAYGERVARERGDTQSLPMTVNSDVEWEILLPEVLRIPRR